MVDGDDSATFNDELSAFYDDFEEQKKVAIENMPCYSSLAAVDKEYTNSTLIAQGGMKSIYKVYDPKTKRDVALARLHPDAPEDMYEPFLREAYLTSQLDHPNIITIHTIGLDDQGIPYFTMELKGGKSLRDLVTGYSLSVTSGSTGNSNGLTHNQQLITNNSRSAMLGIFLKICDAIAYAHSRQILHLDLKPDNIQVGHYGEVVVCDWGLGKQIGDVNDCGANESLGIDAELFRCNTLDGEIKGTPGFMAPEQARKNGIKTERTDIYALGALLYSMITGAAPIAADTQQKIITKTIAGDIETPVKRFPKKMIPQSINSIIMKALACDPYERYDSVELLVDDIRKYQSGYSTQAENAGFFKEVILLYRRNKIRCNTLAVCGTVFVAATAYYITELNRSRILAENERTRAELLRVEADIARDSAEKARTIAVVEQQKSNKLYVEARENLERYEVERDKVFSLGQTIAAEYVRDSKRFTGKGFYQMPVPMIRELIPRLITAHKLDGNNVSVTEILGKAFLIKQDFEQAVNSFEIHPQHNKELLAISREMVLNPKVDNGVLSIPHFITLLAKVGGSIDETDDLAAKLVVYDRKHRRQTNGYIRVVRQLVLAYNSQQKQDECSVTFDKETETLSVRGRLIKNLGIKYIYGEPPHCFLKYLKFKALDVSGTQFTDLSHLSQLTKLEQLNISNTPVSDLSHLKKGNLSALKELIVSENQFPPQQIKSVPQHIKITVLQKNR